MADGLAGLRLMKSHEVDRPPGGSTARGFSGRWGAVFFADQTVHENTDTYYQYATAFPVGTLLAQTWGYRACGGSGPGRGGGNGSLRVELVAAPGMNIHRKPALRQKF